MKKSPDHTPDPRPDSYWNGRGTFKGDARFQRVSPATPFGLVGECLPDLREKEVEIVMIGMRSAMGDVISVRARREGDNILYRVVDEYGDPDFSNYDGYPEESRLPLTQKEMQDFLWSIGESGDLPEGKRPPWPS